MIPSQKRKFVQILTVVILLLSVLLFSRASADKVLNNARTEPFTIESTTEEFRHINKVDYFPQETSYYCGPACVKMALHYLTGSSPAQRDLALEMDTSETANGTYPINLRIPFDRRGFTSVFATNLTFQDLVRYSGKNYVIIIVIWYDLSYRVGHHVLVIGYEAEGVYVHDPSQGEAEGRTTGADAYILVELLERLWAINANWGLVIPYTPTHSPSSSNTTIGQSPQTATGISIPSTSRSLSNHLFTGDSATFLDEGAEYSTNHFLSARRLFAIIALFIILIVFVSHVIMRSFNPARARSVPVSLSNE